jgi:fumarate reductase flavoprotein subunit
MFDQMRAGKAGPRGGLYITMRDLDPAMVRRMFKGMVERCADCGFDLVSGLVDVVPTAHYMMGGVAFKTDCSTDLPGLFVAGEDSGGVHGANRLGGNGVANSTVFGGIAGDVMPGWVKANGAFHAPDRRARRRIALSGAASPPVGVNEKFARRSHPMGDVVISATRQRSVPGRARRARCAAGQVGVESGDLLPQPDWHDWLNLKTRYW